MENQERDEAIDSAIRDAQQAERRWQRSEAHIRQTFTTFIRKVAERTELSDWEAERAVVATLCCLEQRLQPGEARHLEAQLPQLLVDLLQGCTNYAGLRDIDKLGLLQVVSRSLDREEWEVESIVRTVFTVLREKISGGESADIASQLPRPLAELWMRSDDPDLHHVTPEEFIRRDNEASSRDTTAASRQSEPADVPGINRPTPGIRANAESDQAPSEQPSATDSRGRP